MKIKNVMSEAILFQIVFGLLGFFILIEATSVYWIFVVIVINVLAAAMALIIINLDLRISLLKLDKKVLTAIILDLREKIEKEDHRNGH